MISNWISAFRLRTLPLAITSIILGSLLAASSDSFKLPVLLLAILTAVLLQILSNLANDYGDSIHGADSEHRKGPSRAVQSGTISLKQMKIAMYIFGFLSLVSGVSLLAIASDSYRVFMIFLGIGFLSIIASVAYTAGPKPYGYAGLGDISVLLFFGIVGVSGSYFLHTNSFNWVILLPSITCGLFSVAVLNINNMRDIESDKLAGKMSIPVRIGLSNAKIYHAILIVLGLLTALAFTYLTNRGTIGYYYLVLTGFLLRHIMAVFKTETPSNLDPFLKQMAFITLLFCISLGAATYFDGHQA
jgi:1,4-dihydroxy-2-naphthoate polyprenyltransferase